MRKMGLESAREWCIIEKKRRRKRQIRGFTMNRSEFRARVANGLLLDGATGSNLMAAGKPLPSNVIGVLADCGYTSPKEIICEVIRQMKLPSAVCYPFVRLAARLLAGFDLEQDSPLEAVARCQVPMIFFHGEGDDFVPCEMSRRNYAACNARKELITIPGAGHGLAYAVQPQQYLQALRDFFPEG